MALVVASASLAEAVMPTSVPTAAFSATLSAAASVSLIAPTSNSSTSVRAIVNAWVLKLPSAEVARTTMPWLAAALAVQRAGHGHHPGARVDREPSAGVVVQACR